MSKKKKANTMQDAHIDDIKSQACETGGFGSFQELAAVSLARRLLKQGRPEDAERLLQRYLTQHSATPRIMALLKGLK